MPETASLQFVFIFRMQGETAFLERFLLGLNRIWDSTTRR
jgi:hypothetical protein